MTAADPSFYLSAGMGGVCAVVAAVILGTLAYRGAHKQNKAASDALTLARTQHTHQVEQAKKVLVEAEESRKLTESHQQRERWWVQYVWLIEAGDEGDEALSVEARLHIAGTLADQAHKMGAPELVLFASHYVNALRLKLLARQRAEGGQ